MVNDNKKHTLLQVPAAEAITVSVYLSLCIYVDTDENISKCFPFFNLFFCVTYLLYLLVVISKCSNPHFVFSAQMCTGRNYCNPGGFWLWKDSDIAVSIQVFQ